MIVDDEADSRRVAMRILASCGAEVATANSADQGFELFTRFRPHVVVSDIGMPDKDGYNLLLRIRSLPPQEGGQVPAVALTAFARSEDRRKALLAGFQSHVVKPAEPAELIAVVGSLLGRTGPKPP
ncbi:response regulator [Oligoflexus sp.]|uniref:response regulator n=1 Tax=Oligoflexus sp. TaxID=1971216 RepID=UPI0039C9B532